MEAASGALCPVFQKRFPGQGCLHLLLLFWRDHGGRLFAADGDDAGQTEVVFEHRPLLGSGEGGVLNTVDRHLF